MSEQTVLEDLTPIDTQDAVALNYACMQELSNSKASDIVSVNVGASSSVADYMIVCSGTSNRHVSAIAERLQKHLAKRGIHGIHISGEKEGAWVVVDAGNVIAHIMQPETRERYRLEELYRCMAAGEDPRNLPDSAE